MCVKKHDNQIARMESNRADTDRFRTALAELRKKDPAIPGLADAVLSKLGGVEKQAERFVEDFQEIRGEHLSKEQKALHSTQYGPLVKFHGMAMNLFQSRDHMVSDANPMTEMNDEDLSAIVADGALHRLKVDSDFRLLLIRELLQCEPGIIDRLAKDSPMLLEYSNGEN